MVKDPVCGMNVDETKSKHSSTFLDETYYFCWAGCKARFDAEPSRYTGSGGVRLDTGRGPAAVKMESGESAFFCPMHPHIRSGRPGKCRECGMQLEPAGGKEGDHHAVRDFRKRF